MSPLTTTYYFDETAAADVVLNVPLAEDSFSGPAGRLLNDSAYVLDQPAAGGPMPANFSYPFSAGTHLVPYDGYYSGTAQIQTWPCPGWFHSTGQMELAGPGAVAGGGPNPATFNNAVTCWLNVAALDFKQRLTFQFASVDSTYSAMSGTGNTIGVVWLTGRSAPSFMRGGALGNTGVNAVADGTKIAIWAFNNAAHGGFFGIADCPLLDGSTHTLGLDLDGQNVVALMDEVPLVTATLPSGPTAQAGTDQRPLDFFQFAGFQLYRPDAAGDGGPGPAPLTKILHYKAWAALPPSPLKDALVSAEGDYLVDANGNFLLSK